ncbi:hypothetical protein [Sorangium sp. So ce233]|uniref:hypothetical protein n=1 Tax=Sorangium sp. So ce233 TaxID=3133290 RepID=UPI003F63A8D8
MSKISGTLDENSNQFHFSVDRTVQALTFQENRGQPYSSAAVAADARDRLRRHDRRRPAHNRGLVARRSPRDARAP